MECKDFLEILLKYIQDNSVILDNKSFCQMVLPFQAYNGEHINIYVEKSDYGYYLLSDGGHVLFNLSSIDAGLRGQNIRIAEILKTLYGFEFQNEEIIIKCEKNDLGQQLVNHLLAQLSLYNLEFRAEPPKPPAFTSEIYHFLDNYEFDYQKEYSLEIQVNKKIIVHKIDALVNEKLLLQIIGSYSDASYYVNQSAKAKMIPFLEYTMYKKVKDYKRGFFFLKKDQIQEDTLSLVERHSDYQFTWIHRKQFIDTVKSLAAT